MADFIGCKYTVGLNSGTDALHLALRALDIGAGDEVITVAAGFPTTVAPIIQYGAVPVFIDVTIPQYNMDVEALEGALSDKTKAVMAAMPIHISWLPLRVARENIPSPPSL